MRALPFSFFIHWIIISWGSGLVGYVGQNVPVLVLLTIAVIALTDRLVRLWDGLVHRLALTSQPGGHFCNDSGSERF